MASLLRILHFYSETQQVVESESEHSQSKELRDEKDTQLQILSEIAAEFLSSVLTNMSMVGCTECFNRIMKFKYFSPFSTSLRVCVGRMSCWGC